jgi:hypothetical protein
MISSPQKFLTELAYHRSISHWPAVFLALTLDERLADITDQANPVPDAPHAGQSQ